MRAKCLTGLFTFRERFGVQPGRTRLGVVIGMHVMPVMRVCVRVVSVRSLCVRRRPCAGGQRRFCVTLERADVRGLAPADSRGWLRGVLSARLRGQCCGFGIGSRRVRFCARFRLLHRCLRWLTRDQARRPCHVCQTDEAPKRNRGPTLIHRNMPHESTVGMRPNISSSRTALFGKPPTTSLPRRSSSPLRHTR